MTASLDEVLALLDKWKNEGSGIHLVFASETVEIHPRSQQKKLDRR